MNVVLMHSREGGVVHDFSHVLYTYFFKREKGRKTEREKHRLVVLPIYTFTGPFSCVCVCTRARTP